MATPKARIFTEKGSDYVHHPMHVVVLQRWCFLWMYPIGFLHHSFLRIIRRFVVIFVKYKVKITSLS
ncbi:hypothetical protein B4110_1411 [Parageobacillus toebii]|uniref:Uncharacterized protein n=1 Tax=Parageobacillus toebii TaxID=153151 RepID=A0A150ME58_9BACL|nr:hypothetical protein B4110_1411 [Parageobacillus toebii]